VQAAEPTLVVLAQSYYHAWQAFVDGRRAPLLHANYAFQAVPVPAGSHSVEWVYQDWAFRIGGVVSAVALLLCARWALAR
jgi:uncharacterized membrane protein YfhO